MAEFEWWDTTKLCETFNMDGACCMLVDATPVRSIGRPHGFTHTEETKELMRQSALGRDMTKARTASAEARRGKPSPNRGREYTEQRKKGKLIKDGVVYEVDGLMKFGKEHGVNYIHIGNVLNGKRKSHKGFRKYGESN